MNYLIDTTARRLTFLDSRFYLTEDGAPIPSVTTILEAYPKDYHFYKWLKENGDDADKLRDAAGRRGTTVHKMTEDYDAGHEVTLLGGDGELNFRLEEWAMFERYVEFSQRFQPEIIMSEQNFISPSLGYAGTVDRIIRMDGKRILMDIKTSNAIHAAYWLQLAAYKELVTEAGFAVDAVGILWLNAKTRSNGKKGDIQGAGWQLVTVDDTADHLELFAATKQLWHAQNKDIQPRQLSYQLSHIKA